MTTVRELVTRLSGDAWRVTNRFSDDMLQANAILHNPAATEDEMAEGLSNWFKHRQPCQFGKIAANHNRIHYCFLRDEAVFEWSDEEISTKITEDKRLWKQRAAFDVQRAAHSLVIVVASSRIALAAPDKHLRAFSDRILELAGWDTNRRGVRQINTVTSDYLYLRNPIDKGLYGFRYNVDYFACAGDGRWWHDHRCPGGIAFTANSPGHMMRFREWYESKDQSEIWALKQAMYTIQHAAPTKSVDGDDPIAQGQVTWLRPLGTEGKPLVESISCPFSTVPKPLEGKDWTKYEGFLHTDHAVREEFFFDRPVAPTASKPYLMDFTYLYNDKQEDFEEFSRGKRFTDDQVFAEIGRSEDWSHRASGTGRSRSNEEAARVAQQLVACRNWQESPWYVVERDQD